MCEICLKYRREKVLSFSYLYCHTLSLLVLSTRRETCEPGRLSCTPRSPHGCPDDPRHLPGVTFYFSGGCGRGVTSSRLLRINVRLYYYTVYVYVRVRVRVCTRRSTSHFVGPRCLIPSESLWMVVEKIHETYVLSTLEKLSRNTMMIMGDLFDSVTFQPTLFRWNPHHGCSLDLFDPGSHDERRRQGTGPLSERGRLRLRKTESPTSVSLLLLSPGNPSRRSSMSDCFWLLTLKFGPSYLWKHEE